jgi:hypothetical protein
MIDCLEGLPAVHINILNSFSNAHSAPKPSLPIGYSLRETRKTSGVTHFEYVSEHEKKKKERIRRETIQKDRRRG